MVTNNRCSQNFQVAPMEGNITFQRKMWIIGYMFLAILVFILFLFLLFVEKARIEDIVTLFLITVVLLGGIIIMICLIHSFFSPRLYTVDVKGVIIKRLIGEVCINHLKIKRVAVINSMPILWILGATLLFEIGSGAVITFVTRSERLLLIETAERKYYLSPLDPHGMLDVIIKYLKENH